MNNILLMLTTIDKGEIKLLTKDNFEFLNSYVKENMLLDENVELMEKLITNKKLNIMQCHTFDKIVENQTYYTFLYVGFINIDDIDLNKYKLINIQDLSIYTEYINKFIRNNILDNINLLMPTFSLKELQKVYEYILNKKLDRRNFHKKMIKRNLIVDINKTGDNIKGRKARLYCFNRSEE